MKAIASFVLVWLFAATASATVHIDVVPVGNPGNANDPDTGNLYGSVGYAYSIGKYEVTNSQYNQFLNRVDPSGLNTFSLYNSGMTTNANGGINFTPGATTGEKYSVKPGRGNNPVNFVSWYDAIRFANWLQNGQGTETETGAYTLGALDSNGIPIDGFSITRNPGATWSLPTENEWYKAAYHKNDGVTGDYWAYPTSHDTVPFSDQPPGLDAPDKTNTANGWANDNLANNYNDGHAVTGLLDIDPALNHLADVGAYSYSPSPYGTYDQAGSLWEWNEAILVKSQGPERGLRGGAWDFITGGAGIDFRNSDDPARGGIELASKSVGFRVALLNSTNVPEPTACALALIGAAALPLIRHRFRYE